MRFALALFLLLAIGCSSKSTQQDEAEIVTQIGVIKAKEDFDIEESRSDSRVTTSVHASVSSGGRSSISIGLGFLLSQFGSGSSDPDPVRYEVELLDGGQMTIYHQSRDFEVDDCVEIRVYPDEEKNPPGMKRNKDACTE